MPEPQKTRWRGSVLHVGAALTATPPAIALTVIVWQIHPTFHPETYFVIFLGFLVAVYFVWIWVFVYRQAELAKKLPISSAELRRRQEEFYNSFRR